MRISAKNGKEIHRTEVGALTCTWEIEQGAPRICFMRDYELNRPAVTYPDIPLLGYATGTIAFNEHSHPTLRSVADDLPQYKELWDTIRQEHARAFINSATCSDARAFAPEEEAAVRKAVERLRAL